MYVICLLSLQDFRNVSRLFVSEFPSIDDIDFATAWSSIDLCSSMGLYYNSTLVGFGLVSAGSIAFLTLHKDHRGGGNGTRLLNAIQATCDELTLKPVNCDRVISWYKRHGFVISRVMPFIHTDIPTCEMTWVRSDSPNSSRSTTRTASWSGSTTSRRRTSSVVSDEGSIECISDDEILPPRADEILSAVGRLRRGGEI
jgi:GNAT superfamily N-acetyltransferase